jgi:hypothetical protein
MCHNTAAALIRYLTDGTRMAARNSVAVVRDTSCWALPQLHAHCSVVCKKAASLHVHVAHALERTPHTYVAHALDTLSHLIRRTYTQLTHTPKRQFTPSFQVIYDLSLGPLLPRESRAPSPCHKCARGGLCHSAVSGTVQRLPHALSMPTGPAIASRNTLHACNLVEAVCCSVAPLNLGTPGRSGEKNGSCFRRLPSYRHLRMHAMVQHAH